MSSTIPSVHSVHIYEEDSALITRLCGIVGSGLRLGDSVLIVATPPHRNALVKELNAVGVNVRSHAREGRFTMLDAEDVLATFLVDGMPDRERFMLSIGAVLEDARAKSVSAGRSLTVFGEMVAVLWDQGNKRGALELEALWNDALNDRAFHLHCAYPRSGFINGDEEAVCRSHSHVVH